MELCQQDEALLGRIVACTQVVGGCQKRSLGFFMQPSGIGAPSLSLSQQRRVVNRVRRRRAHLLAVFLGEKKLQG